MKRILGYQTFVCFSTACHHTCCLVPGVFPDKNSYQPTIPQLKQVYKSWRLKNSRTWEHFKTNVEPLKLYCKLRRVMTLWLNLERNHESTASRLTQLFPSSRHLRRKGLLYSLCFLSISAVGTRLLAKSLDVYFVLQMKYCYFFSLMTNVWANNNNLVIFMQKMETTSYDIPPC